MKNNFKRLFIITAAGALFLVALLVVQYKIIGVSAQTIILPVIIEQEGLDFGTVFPGEELTGEFIIQYVDDPENNSIAYQIILREKPFPPGHPEYPGYYKNLCPHLEAVSVEETGDTGVVGRDDVSDVWTIYFKVPAILGNVSQNHQGGVVTSNGEYGCDISIDIVP